MHPIMRSIAKGFDSLPEEGTSSKIGKYLALVNYHSNPITSAMFVTATAPNPLTVELISIATGADIQLTWMTWALAMLLPGLVAILAMPYILYLLYPPDIKQTPQATQMARDKLAEMGKISRDEVIMLLVFLVLLLLWADIPAIFLGDAVTLNTTTSAFIGLSLLLITGVFDLGRCAEREKCLGYAAMVWCPYHDGKSVKRDWADCLVFKQY